MSHIIKIFCSDKEQDKIAREHPLLERYQGFVLAQVSNDAIQGIAKEFPVEDISEQYTLRIGDTTIDTSSPRLDQSGKLHKHPHYTKEKKLSSGFHHHLVQFIGPIKDQWLRKLKKTGAEPRTSMGSFTYVVRADDKIMAQVLSLPFVRWAGHLPHSDRIAESVLNNAGRKSYDVGSDLPRTRVIPGAYMVEFFSTKELNAGISAIKKLGFQIQSKDPKACLLIVSDPKSGTASAKRLVSLSAIHGVRFIRERIIKRISNNVATTIMAGAQELTQLELSGEGEIIGVCDTGLDTADPRNIHSDFSGRIAGIKSYPMTADLAPYVHNPNNDDGASDLDSGHGTHVAGSVLGDGSASADLPGQDKNIRGLAYKAKLYFQAVEQEMQWKDPKYYELYGRYLLTGLPNDLSELFNDAYRKKVRIHSNSWGGGDPGAYDSQCEQLDQFVWNNKDFCILFANGNDGTDKDGDGSINPMSVSAPATAKNCIAVGASENERKNFNHNTYGGWWSNDYPASPYKTDPMADNAEHIAAFSSRGPTQDGRVKPDVVAPGTFILSTRSSMLAQNNNAWAAFPASKKYFHMGGTSMATPLVAGAVGVLRQFFRTHKNIPSPSAALLKAALIHGAKRLRSENSATTGQFDNEQGFGRVNVNAIVAPADGLSMEFLEIKPGLRTGELHQLEFTIQSSDKPLRITLAYSDYPGPSLVNNLNLMLTAPDGSRHVGNPQPGNLLNMDTINNVEVAHIENPLTGLWKVAIVASNIPQGPQDFALVYSADIGENIEDSLIIHSQSQPMLEIPDLKPSGVKDSIRIDEDGMIASLRVSVDIEHTYIGDLKVSLKSPGGHQAMLHERSGASTKNLVKTYTMTDTPALEVFKNISCKGKWSLSVSDHASIDKGLLRSWELVMNKVIGRKVDRTATPHLAIPDNDSNGITDTIHVSKQGLIKQIQVSVDITHTWIADLSVSVLSPSGKSVILHRRSGGSLDNIIETFSINNLPELATLLGSEANGDWSLKVVDSAGRDLGKLNQWRLELLL